MVGGEYEVDVTTRNGVMTTFYLYTLHARPTQSLL